MPVSVMGNVEQATKWWKGHAHAGQWGEDSRWHNPDNWFMSVPGSDDIADLNVGSGDQPVIDANNVGSKKAVCRMLGASGGVGAGRFIQAVFALSDFIYFNISVSVFA